MTQNKDHSPQNPIKSEKTGAPTRNFSTLRKFVAVGGLAVATAVGGYLAGHSTSPKAPRAVIERSVLDGHSASPANELFKVVDHKVVPVRPPQLDVVNQRFNEAAQAVGASPNGVELGYPLPTEGEAYAFREGRKVYITGAGQELQIVSEMLQAAEGPEGIIKSPTPSIANYTTDVQIHPGTAPSSNGK
jgi:hypothetical protein